MTPSRTAAAPRTRPGGRPPIDPRIRQRRASVARRRGRRRLWALAAALAVAALALGAWTLVHSHLLSARVVTVRGSVHTPAAAVIAAAGLTGDPPLLDVSPSAAAAGVQRLPWVARATVVRHWPDAVSVSVVERVPVAVVPGTAATGGPWAEVDRTGRLLTTVASPPPGLVRLASPAAAGAPGTTLAPGASPGLTVAASLPPAFAGQVSEVDVAAGQVTLKLTTPVTVNLGSTAQLHSKYEDVATLLARATLRAGDVLDVSVPESPVVTGP